MNEAWVFPKGQVVRGIIEDAFRAHGLSMPSEHVTTDTVHIRNHLLATGTFSYLHCGLCSDATTQSNGLLKHCQSIYAVKPRPHAIVTLKNRTLNPVAELFIRELKAVASSTLR